MTLRGVLKVGGLVAGGLVVVGVAIFYLAPRSCGCSQEPDPQRLVGLDGPALANETSFCSGLEAEPPRDELTWLTVVGAPQLIDYTGPWSDDVITAFEAVPYGSFAAAPTPVTVVAAPGVIVTDELPADSFTLHVAVVEDGDGSLTAPLGIVETSWGAAYFTGNCADAGLRDTRLGTLADADVASWPSLTLSEFEALYGPPPPDPQPITEEALHQAAQSPNGPIVDASISLAAQGDMPAGDKIRLATAWGVLNPETITGLGQDPTVGVGAPVPVGEVVGVVLERDGRYFLLDTLEVPGNVPPGTNLATEVTVNYVDTQSLEPLGDGAAAVVPTVLARPFYPS